LKKVLIVSYSQSGQLSELVTSLSSPIRCDEIEINHKIIKPKKDYPFPWSFFDFMDCFPESIYMDPCEIEEVEDSNDYDLVIIFYQVWFLSPSIPVTSFLKSKFAQDKLKNKPVITVIGCRNMWVMAQEKMKNLLKDLDAKLIDNIVLIDQGNSIATFFTTPRWMLTGRKNSFWKIFPEAGIDKQKIKNSSRFGFAIKEAITNNLEKENKSICYGLNAVSVDEKLIKSEQIGTKSFMIWGKLIRKIGKPGDIKRKPFLALYTAFLILMIIVVVPINMIVQTIIRRINKKKILKEKAFYEMPSGSEDFRMKDFSKYE